MHGSLSVNEVKLSKRILVQLNLIVTENCLVLFLAAELYIMKMHCSWFIGAYHTNVYCPEGKI